MNRSIKISGLIFFLVCAIYLASFGSCLLFGKYADSCQVYPFLLFIVYPLLALLWVFIFIKSRRASDLSRFEKTANFVSALMIFFPWIALGIALLPFQLHWLTNAVSSLIIAALLSWGNLNLFLKKAVA